VESISLECDIEEMAKNGERKKNFENYMRKDREDDNTNDETR